MKLVMNMVRMPFKGAREFLALDRLLRAWLEVALPRQRHSEPWPVGVGLTAIHNEVYPALPKAGWQGPDAPR